LTLGDNDAVEEIAFSVTLVSVGGPVSVQTVSGLAPCNNDTVGEVALSVTLVLVGGPVSERTVSGSTPFANDAVGEIPSSVTLMALVPDSVLTTPSCLAILAVSLLTLALKVWGSLFCFLVIDMTGIAKSVSVSPQTCSANKCACDC
jgi:hypothetical protein